MSDFIGALTPVLALALIFGFILALRYMRHREALKMIEHGMSPNAPPAPSPFVPTPMPVERSGGSRAQLVWGLTLAGVGLALTLALWPIGFAVNSHSDARFPLGIGPWMVAGFTPLFVGLALVLAFVLAKPERTPPPPPPYYPPAPFPPLAMPPRAPLDEPLPQRADATAPYPQDAPVDAPTTHAPDERQA